MAQIDASTWAVSARGFNGHFANKLLVLVDGRNVYSELFGGVHWDMQTMPLSDIERIEVVRGPGGSLWGSNAVNGIVNIITKAADQTQGGFAKATVAGVHRGGAEMRYGGRMGPAAYYRLYGQYSTQGTGLPLEGFADPDDASQRLGGVRGRLTIDSQLLSLARRSAVRLGRAPVRKRTVPQSRRAPATPTPREIRPDPCGLLEARDGATRAVGNAVRPIHRTFSERLTA